MHDNEIYYLDFPRDVACSKHYTVCLFMQGNVPYDGVNGTIIKERIIDLFNHECNVCGSVPLSGDNNSDEMGILTSNSISEGSCDGVCPGYTPLVPQKPPAKAVKSKTS